jgi:hypothetical protein
VRKPLALLGFLGMALMACSPSVPEVAEPLNGVAPAVQPNGLVDARGNSFPPAPIALDGELDPAVAAAVARLLETADTGLDLGALEVVAGSGDPRLAWLVADLFRFLQAGQVGEALQSAFSTLTGLDLADDPAASESPWRAVTDHLIAWDLPAPPGYVDMKRELYLLVEPRWAPFFNDEKAAIDWRWVSWGGVYIDDRPLGDTGFCERGCIPGLDDPALTDADGGDWYSDGYVVFGTVVDGEAIAFPKNMMEVHEMVNIAIGGRRLGIPYCTLCGSAQAYFLDRIPRWSEPIVLRTSGLLARSNKVMYDLTTMSVIDTFTGIALSGPLHDAGVELEQHTVVGSTWGDWKLQHPDTMIVAQDGGIGRRYEEDPLQGRDAAGPIFPVGDVDPRLAAQAVVVGVISPAGKPLAFPLEAARLAVARGEDVAFNGVRLVSDGSGFRAEAQTGDEVVAHQAFWFAWSQFHPGTMIWDVADSE